MNPYLTEALSRAEEFRKEEHPQRYMLWIIALADEIYRMEGNEEPPEDGEDFRGGEAAAFIAEQQAWIQRNLK